MPVSVTYCVKSVVDEMFDIFTHTDLSHQLVLVAIHAGQLANVSEHILQTIRQLEGVDVAQAILYVTVNHKFCQTQDLAAQVESIAKPGLLTLLQ